NPARKAGASGAGFAPERMLVGGPDRLDATGRMLHVYLKQRSIMRHDLLLDHANDQHAAVFIASEDEAAGVYLLDRNQPGRGPDDGARSETAARQSGLPLHQISPPSRTTSADPRQEAAGLRRVLLGRAPRRTSDRAEE